MSYRPVPIFCFSGGPSTNGAWYLLLCIQFPTPLVIIPCLYGRTPKGSSLEAPPPRLVMLFGPLAEEVAHVDDHDLFFPGGGKA